MTPPRPRVGLRLTDETGRRWVVVDYVHDPRLRVSETPPVRPGSDARARCRWFITRAPDGELDTFELGLRDARPGAHRWADVSPAQLRAQLAQVRADCPSYRLLDTALAYRLRLESRYWR